MLLVCPNKSKSFLTSLIFFLFFLMTFLPVPLPEALAARQASPEIVAGAKKEGKLLFYTTSSIEVGKEMLNQFQKKYPFIQPDIYRTGSQGMLSKVLAEMKFNKNSVDVLMVPGGPGLTLKEKGFYAKYVSTEDQYFPEGFKDPDGHWTDVYSTLNGFVYNTNQVSPKEAPRTWDDLLNPKWKGKIGLDTKSYEWFGYMLKFMGEKKGLEYMRKLAEQDLKFYSGRTLMAQLATAGELSMALVYRGDVKLIRDKGGPVDWAGLDPIVPSIHPIGVAAKAPHPNAARLFIDFALSKEGQETWVRVYRVPSRPDVKPPDMASLNVVKPDFDIIANYTRYEKPYREILMKR